MQAAPEKASGLLRNRNWNLLFVGQAVSLVGDAVFDLTIVLWVGTVIAHGQSWAPAAVGGVLIAAAVPVFVVGPVAGVFVDRWDRRHIMMITDVVRAVLIFLLIMVSLDAHHLPRAFQLGAVYVVIALASAASQFFNPSRFAMIGTVVPEEDRARAFSLSQASVSSAAVIGPPLAAPLLFSVGVQWALIVNAGSFIASFLSVSLIRLPQAHREDDSSRQRFRTEFLEGLKFFTGNRTLVLLTAALGIYTLGVGALSVLNVFFVQQNLHVSASWLGTISCGFGIGSVAGALLVGKVAPRLTEIRTFYLGLSLTGLVILVYSRMTLLPAAIVVLALAGIPVAAVSTVAGPLVLRTTPMNLVGRVSAVLNPLMQLSSIISMALAGFLASTLLLHFHLDVAGVQLGRIDTILGCGAILMIASGIAIIRPLRHASASNPVPVAGQLTIVRTGE